VTWPPVFDGIGALFVGANNDPDVQAERIPGLTWAALKVNGTDTSPAAERDHWRERMMARGISVGAWIYNYGPPVTDVTTVGAWPDLPFVVYDVEREYKRDETWEDPPGTVHHGQYQWATQLVDEHKARRGGTPVAVTSYGGYKTSIDFASFAKAGWPIFAQVYDSFAPGDELTYSNARGGPYPVSGIHRLTRSLTLVKGEAVYRPESIDG
jgi:hypothetical protein